MEEQLNKQSYRIEKLLKEIAYKKNELIFADWEIAICRDILDSRPLNTSYTKILTIRMMDTAFSDLS